MQSSRDEKPSETELKREKVVKALAQRDEDGFV